MIENEGSARVERAGPHAPLPLAFDVPRDEVRRVDVQVAHLVEERPRLGAVSAVPQVRGARLAFSGPRPGAAAAMVAATLLAAHRGAQVLPRRPELTEGPLA